MFVDYETFRARADAVRALIAESCLGAGRDPRTVQLLAVTKTHPPAAAEYAFRYGLHAVGENRGQEAVDKRSQCAFAVRWELIGHLQSNKARLAARTFDRVQSVDSAKLLHALDQAAGDAGRRLPILLQVNTGRDPDKFGVDTADAPRLLEASLACAHLQVDGLMTIPALSDDPGLARRAFAELRELRDRLAVQAGSPLSVLSMGMTADLGIAVAEGSTLVRVGTALYGPREGSVAAPVPVR